MENDSEKVIEKQLFTVEITRKEFLKLPIEAREEGRKEVIQFFTNNCYVQNVKATMAWQSQLEKWGIK